MKFSFRPTPIFWICAVSYCLVWAFLCLAMHSNYWYDISEQYFVGDLWVLGTKKHPAISCWYLNIVRYLCMDAEIAPYLAVELLALVVLWGIWQLARDIFQDERFALLVVLATASYRFLSTGFLVINNDTALAACWVTAILCFYRAVRRSSLRYWLLTGVFIGIGFHCKYTIAFLALAMPCFLCVNSHARKNWKTFGPYLTILAAFLIFLPHLIWLVRNDFPTFQYSVGSFQHQRSEWWFALYPTAKLLVGAAFALLLPLVVLTPITGCFWQWRPVLRTEKSPAMRFNTAFLGTLIAVPLAIHLMIALLGRYQQTIYLMSIGMCVPLFLLTCLQRDTKPIPLRNSVILGFVSVIGIMTVWSGVMIHDARYGDRPKSVSFPGKVLAQKVEQTWEERFGDTPCPFITELGDIFLCGTVHTYGKRRIPVHHPKVTLLSTDEDVNRRGGIVLWYVDRIPDIETVLKKRYPRAEILPPIVIPYEKPLSPKFPPERIGIALIPPSDHN